MILQAPDHPPVDLMDVLTSPGMLVIEGIAMLVVFYFMWRFIKKHPMKPFSTPPTGRDWEKPEPPEEEKPYTPRRKHDQ
jgi:hypothetical protein